MKTIVEKGKQLAFLLRHDRKYVFDEHGWRDVSDLISNHGFTKEMLDEIVRSNNKQRYEYSDDKSKIRARQGHSVNVDVELREMTPPEVLFHGTSEKVIDAIRAKGVVKGSRLYVHLSTSEEIAISVGKRHGKPVVIKIDTRQMHLDGIKFYLSNNGVWLTEYVSPRYIIEIFNHEL